MAQTTLYDAQGEQQLMATLWSPQLKDDPLAYVRFVYPWGQAGTPLAKSEGPRKWQRKFLNDIKEHIKVNHGTLDFEMLRAAVASSRGVGKSALVAWLVGWFLSTRIGSTVIVSANSESQLRSVTWSEIIKWQSMALNSHWYESSATKITPAKWLTALVEKDLKMGTRYWECNGRLWSEESPDSFAGAHNDLGMMVIFDESSGIPDSIWSVASGFFTEISPPRYMFAYSNPRRNSGAFYECFFAKRAFWKTYHIDGREIEGIDQKVYQQIIDEYGPDSYQARVEVMGEFPSASEDQFIASDIVDDAMKRAAHKDLSAPIILGVDPARFGADSTVILARQGRDIISIKRYHGDDTMTVVGHIIEAIEEFSPALVVIDEGGLGGGIVDRLKEQRYKVRGVNFGNRSKNPLAFGNLRMQMWSDMRNWLRQASIPLERSLKTDLISPKTKPDSSGTLFLESKKEMRSRGLASPDAADALAVTFAFPVAHRDTMHTADRKRADFILTQPQNKLSWMGH